MHLKTALLGFLPALVAADIRELQAKLPTCSLACLAKGADTFNCELTDLYCQCTQLEAIKEVVAPCLVNEGGCELEEVTDTVEVVFNMCVEYFEVNNITTTDSESSSSSTTDHKPEEGAGLTTTASMRVLSIAVFALTATLSL